MRRGPRRSRWVREARHAALATLLMLAGCAGPGAPGAPASERLARLAASGGVERAGDVGGEPPEPPEAGLAPIPREDPRWAFASATLEEVAASWSDEVSAGESTVSEASRDRALRLYAEGRVLIANDRAGQAITLLEQASSLDPESPEVWRALGEARRAGGFEASAGAAFVKAAELGLNEPEALTLAGLHLSRRAEHERAARLLTRAVSGGSRHADPLIADVAWVHLGESLLELGRLRAGCEALERGLGMPMAARVPTTMGAEAGALHRRRGELLLRMGDGWLRLGAFERAASAFERSAQTPSGDTPETRTRRVYALRRAGRPAEAALLLLEDLNAGVAFDGAGLRSLGVLAAQIRPRTLLAEAIAEIDDGGSATRRANLELARASALPADRARLVLEAALLDPHLRSSALQHRLLSARLALDPPDERRLRLIDRLVAARAGLAGPASSALFERHPEPAAVWGMIARGVRDPGRRATLLGELAPRFEDPARTREAITLLEQVPVSGARLALIASLAGGVGAWATLDDAIDRLELMRGEMGGAGSDDLDRAMLRALEAGQRFDEASVLARSIAERGDADDLVHASALSMVSGRGDEARTLLERAIERDPSDERAYRALLTFHGPTGPAPDGERSAELGRLLRERSPSGRLMRQVIVGEILRRGLVNEAGERLERLFDEDPTDENTLEMMLMHWRRLVELGRASELPIDSARAAMEANPASTGLTRLLVGGLVLRGRHAEAVGEIEAFEARRGVLALGRLREQLIREGLDDPERSERLALERLGDPPRSIEGSLEYAELRSRRLDGSAESDGRVVEVAGALGEIPARAMPTDPQRVVVSSLVTRLATHLNLRRERGGADASTEGIAERTLAVMNRAASWRAPMAPATHDLRLTLLVERRSPLSEVASAAMAAMGAYPASGRTFARRVTELLTGASREEDAFSWIAEASFEGGWHPEAFAEWFRLVVVSAERDRGAALLGELVSRGRLSDAWTVVRPESPGWDDRDGDSPAEHAYLMAQYAGGGSNREASMVFLRLALEYDPRHPWACNDLGYTLLETGGSLEEAEHLIEIAYEAMPDRASIIDSLGWVRYHLGHLEDETDESTGAVRLGAVSLLRRASELDTSNDDGVVFDHLGDALYAAGRIEEATEAWRLAAQQANRALSTLRATGRGAGVRSREIQQLAADAAMKRNAVKLGQTPAIAPQRGLAGSGENPRGASDDR